MKKQTWIAAGLGLGLWSRSNADAWFAGILAIPLLILPPIILVLRWMERLKEPQGSVWFYAIWFAGVGVVVALMFFVFGS